MKYLTGILLVLAFQNLYGQNMVPNGSFETYTSCPTSPSQVTGKVSGWYTYSGGTSDYFNSCSTSSNGTPLNFIGHQVPADGNAYVGVFTYNGGSSNYKEYVATAISPLTIGRTYEVSMSVSLADTVAYSSDDLGVYFFDNGPSTVSSPAVLPVTPQISYSGYGSITNKTAWTRLTSVFVADSAYDNIVIGGFKDYSNQVRVLTPTGGSSLYYGSSYYYIDSVVVKKLIHIYINYTDSLLCAGDSIHVPYTVLPTNFFNTTNTFILQLSDSAGSFSSPTILGTHSGNNGGIFNTIIPATIAHGSGYRIRIVSNSPVDSSETNGANITINNQIPAGLSASSNSPVCATDSIKLFAASTTGGVTYLWNGPNSFSIFNPNPSIANATAANAGNYIITYLLNGCSAKDTVNVVVNPKPTAITASTNSPVCAGNTLNLASTSSTTGSTYSWTGPNSFSSSVQNPNITNAQTIASGDYIVTATLGLCTTKDTITADVKPLPANVTASNNGPVCQGSTLSLSGSSSSTGVSYSWTGPNGFTSTLQNPTISNAQPPLSGTYNLITALNGCTVQANTNAVVTAIPSKPTAGSNTPVCNGTILNLTATPVSSATYSWSGPAAFTSLQQNPSVQNVTSSMAGAYIVRAVSGNCYSLPDTVNITVIPAPNVSIYPNPNDTICQGANVTFVAVTSNAGSSVSYRWLKNNMLTGTAGSYSSTAINDKDEIYCEMTATGVCADPYKDSSNKIVMTVLPWLAPSVSITSNPSTPLSPYQLVNFTATATDAGNAPQYQWQRNGTDVVGATSYTWGTYQLSNNDSISVIVTSSYMCPQPAKATSNVIKVQILTGINEIGSDNNISLYPNPNKGSFSIKGKMANGDVRLEIINALGQIVYRSGVKIYNGELNEQVDAGELASGIYSIRISTAGSTRYTRFSIDKD